MSYWVTWEEPAGKSIFTGEELPGRVEAGTVHENKLEAVRYYIGKLKSYEDISDLKIFKGNRDITASVNRFLSA